MANKPLEIFLFNGGESDLCAQAHVFLSGLLEKIQLKLIAHEPSLKGHEVNLILTDEDTIKELNAQFRKVNSPTDVLAFPPDGELTGEVWICPSIIEKNAKKCDQPYKREVVRVFVHGILHLAGHDHEGAFEMDAENESEPMFRVQEGIVADISV